MLSHSQWMVGICQLSSGRWISIMRHHLKLSHHSQWLVKNGEPSFRLIPVKVSSIRYRTHWEDTSLFLAKKGSRRSGKLHYALRRRYIVQLQVSLTIWGRYPWRCSQWRRNLRASQDPEPTQMISVDVSCLTITKESRDKWSELRPDYRIAGWDESITLLNFDFSTFLQTHRDA